MMNAWLQKAASTFMQQNVMLTRQMEAIWTALGNLIGPIVERLVSWVVSAVSYLISFLNLLGITSKTASQLSKQTQGSASALQKTVAGFDELNVLQDTRQGSLPDLDPKEWMSELSELLKAGQFAEAGRYLAAQLNEMVANIDWVGIGNKLAYGFKGAVDFLGNFIRDFDVHSLGRYVADMDTWLKNTELCGGDVVAGLLLGILNGMANIGKWIYEHVFKPFIDGFNSAFQIHSPSLVMEKSGGFIIQGLLTGLQTGWDTITEWLSNAIASFENSWISFKVFFVNLWHDITTGVKGAINGIIGCINGLIAGMVSGVNAVANTLNRIRVEIPGWVPGFGGKIFGFSLPTFSAPQIPYLEKGGVLKKGQVGLLEGSGAEAVVPLERNTEWINKMADAFMARVQAGSYDLTGNAKTIAALETFADRITYRAPAMAAGNVLPYSVSGQAAGGGSFETAGVYELLQSISDKLDRLDRLDQLEEMVFLLANMQFVADFGNNIRALARRITKEQRRDQIMEGR